MPIHSKLLGDDKVLLTIEGSKGNSFGPETLKDLLQKLEDYNNDTIKGIIITGAGRAFSVGGDVFAMHEALEKGSASSYLEPVVPLIEEIVLTILQYPKPVIAAVNGAAAGGGLSLALACDEVVAVENAKFGMAFGGLALSPDSGSSVLYAHYFGRKEAIDGISTARVYSAKEVAGKGIIKVVEADQLVAKATSLIDMKTSVSAYSYGMTKLLVNQGLIKQLKHNLPMEFGAIVEASGRDEFSTKVRATVSKLTK